tara:strand:- start:125 stop:631 length:507 start_codon:yes stop_codon:yes gene_type:complete
MGTKRVGWARIKSLVNENQNELKTRNEQVIACSSTTVLTAGQSGALIYWTHSGSNHDITLPAAKKGLSFRFRIAVGHAAEHRILIAGDDHFTGRVNVVSVTANKTSSQVANKSDNMIHINLHATTTTLGGDIGDQIDVYCMEDGFWTVSANLTLRTGNPASTAVFSAS